MTSASGGGGGGGGLARQTPPPPPPVPGGAPPPVTLTAAAAHGVGAYADLLNVPSLPVITAPFDGSNIQDVYRAISFDPFTNDIGTAAPGGASLPFELFSATAPRNTELPAAVAAPPPPPVAYAPPPPPSAASASAASRSRPPPPPPIATQLLAVPPPPPPGKGQKRQNSSSSPSKRRQNSTPRQTSPKHAKAQAGAAANPRQPQRAKANIPHTELDEMLRRLRHTMHPPGSVPKLSTAKDALRKTSGTKRAAAVVAPPAYLTQERAAQMARTGYRMPAHAANAATPAGGAAVAAPPAALPPSSAQPPPSAEREMVAKLTRENRALQLKLTFANRAKKELEDETQALRKENEELRARLGAAMHNAR
ncbi:hypothetical protein NFJ02_40g106410 [Pycnococcus provasolii]